MNRRQVCLNFFNICFLALIFQGCSFYSRFNPDYIPASKTQAMRRIPGKILIVIPKDDPFYVYKSRPQSFTGSGTTLTLELGNIVGEITKKVYCHQFEKGCELSDKVESGEYAIIISPKIVKYEYQYNQARNFFLAVTPQVKIELEIHVQKGQKKDIEKLKSTDWENGSTYMLTFEPGEKVSQISHYVLYQQIEKSFVNVQLIMKDTITDLY